MPAAPDIVARLRRACVTRRAPSWLAALVPWLLTGRPAGALCVALLGAADMWWHWRRANAAAYAWLDASVPALEDSARLLAGVPAGPVAQLQRARLESRLAEMLRDGTVGRVAARHTGRALPWVVLSALAALAFVVPDYVAQRGARSHMRLRPAAVAPDVVLHIDPPAYTGQPAFDVGRRDATAPAGSVLRWCASGPASAVELSGGQVLRMAPCATWTAGESLFWRWAGQRHTVTVIPDRPPAITIAAPRDLLATLSASARTVTIDATVRDDYRVARATLHLTLARGSGENIRFSDREVPFAQGTDARMRRLQRNWTLGELGMEPGDELYFFVRASDNADPAHQVQSPTYTVRLPGPVADDSDTSATPVLVQPESLRSERQIIIDTEQLLADARHVTPATMRARSESLATDQAVLRHRYGQFLGEESTLFGHEDEDHHHEQAEGKPNPMSEYVHMHDQAENATLFDDATKKILRRALAAMWEAEKQLRALAPARALPSEHGALDAIKELQQAERVYLHKTAFAPPPIKEDVRLSGDVTDARSSREPEATAPPALPADVAAVFAALATGAPLPAAWSRTALGFLDAQIADDASRLAAQRAVQDVGDGCVPCRAVLRAWLRQAAGPAPVLLQPGAAPDNTFSRALRGAGAR